MTSPSGFAADGLRSAIGPVYLPYHQGPNLCRTTSPGWSAHRLLVRLIDKSHSGSGGGSARVQAIKMYKRFKKRQSEWIHKYIRNGTRRSYQSRTKRGPTDASGMVLSRHSGVVMKRVCVQPPRGGEISQGIRTRKRICLDGRETTNVSLK